MEDLWVPKHIVVAMVPGLLNFKIDPRGSGAGEDAFKQLFGRMGVYSMLRISASGPEIGLPGRISSGLLP